MPLRNVGFMAEVNISSFANIIPRKNENLCEGDNVILRTNIKRVTRASEVPTIICLKD